MDELINREVLGRVVTYVYVVEFQKRGLPLIHLRPEDKLIDGNQVDQFIYAELPDVAEDPKLYRIITTVLVLDMLSIGDEMMEEFSKKNGRGYVFTNACSAI